FGINFFLREESVDISTAFTTVVGGQPIDKENGSESNKGNGAESNMRSDLLAGVYYGAVHTMVIVQSNLKSEEAYATADAARALLRYLWMGYGILSEASRRLLTLQADRYLGDTSSLLRQESPAQMVQNLEVAAQLSHLLISEFHFSMFWES